MNGHVGFVAVVAALVVVACTPSDPKPASPAPVRPDSDQARGGPDANDPLTQRWCADVVWPMEALRKDFPFDPDRHDADPDQLRALLAPGTGAIWKLAEGPLAAGLREDAGRYATLSGADGPAVDPKVAAFLTRARVVADALLRDDGTLGATLEVALATPPADHTWTFSVATATATGPAPAGADPWQPVAWPGEPPHFAEIRSVGAGSSAKLRRDGTFGLLRLLESATIDKADDGTVTATWDLSALDKQPFVLRLRATDPASAVWIDVDPLHVFGHDDLRPPRRLLVGGPQCD